MTLGEKIVCLREKKGYSQEMLGEALSVSRQSVSKWEMGQAIPSINKILEMCKLFSISLDALLRDEVEIAPESSNEKENGNINNKYFGTDGFRGEAGIDLTSLHAYKIGRFLGWYYSSLLSGCRKHNYTPRIVIGKDTRRSSYMLEYSIAAGVAASGADVYMLHVTTTPSVSYVTRCDEFDAGVMITASHNPFYDNGIKIINKYGEKLDDKTASLIEAYIDGNFEALGLDSDIPYAKREKIGKIIDYVAGRNRYVGYLISLASHSYRKLKIGIDSANGASFTIAKSVFEALGAVTYVTGTEPDGVNINRGVGSTHIENLVELVKEKHLDVGFAFDGDADRCIAVDSDGNVVDGDAIIYILSKRLKERDSLYGDTAVVTVMSNSALYTALADVGVKYEVTAVGDRFVYERMQQMGYTLGGEQSGHIILKKYATTGDGILTAIMLCEEICDRKLPLSALHRDLKLYPQKTENVPVFNKAKTANDPDVKSAVESVKAKIGEKGRVMLRESGTENVVRIMVEAETEALCSEYIKEVYEAIREKGYINA
jgi:phosphoglucosamine mutase